MATYVIGDLHGCFDELLDLLALIKFNEQSDNIFFTGDLINGAAKSLECLDYVKYLVALPGNECVLGNHDVVLAAAGLGLMQPPTDRKYGMESVLASSKLPEYLTWLLARPLCIDLPEFNYFLVHAGVHPQLDVATCLSLSAHTTAMLASSERDLILSTLHSKQPTLWDPNFSAVDKVKFALNMFTQMRFLNNACQELEFAHKDNFNLATQNAQLTPWFDFMDFDKFKRTVIFGHWASLERYSNLPGLWLCLGTNSCCAKIR
jgi:bis(5'-nucleosyl)-tetraphosphatase (symmetrical)